MNQVTVTRVQSEPTAPSSENVWNHINTVSVTEEQTRVRAGQGVNNHAHRSVSIALIVLKY